MPTQLTCRQCGTRFEHRITRGTVPRYCGDDCRRLARGRPAPRPAQKPAAERPCNDCGTMYIPRLAGALQLYCSTRCKERANNARRPKVERPSLAERFWSHVDRSGGPDAHWMWIASPGRRGSGAFRVGGRSENGGYTIASNRIAFALGNDVPIEDVRYVRPTCGERLCQNPAHLTDTPPRARPDGTPMSIEDLIAARVERDDLEHEIWQGALDANDYPVIWLGKDYDPPQGFVGRLRWEAANGPIPEGYVVSAQCRERYCVALEHLICAPREVILSQHRGSLDDDAVAEIREAYANGDVTQQALADAYGVNQRTISNVVQRKSFKHVA